MKKTLTQQLNEATQLLKESQRLLQESQQQLATLKGECDAARNAHTTALNDIRVLRQSKDAEITYLSNELNAERTVHKATLDMLAAQLATNKDLNARIVLLAKPMKVTDGVTTATITTDLKAGTRSSTLTVALVEPEGTRAAVDAAKQKALESTRKAVPMVVRGLGKSLSGDVVLAAALFGGLPPPDSKFGGETIVAGNCDCPECMAERQG